MNPQELFDKYYNYALGLQRYYRYIDEGDFSGIVHEALWRAANTYNPERANEEGEKATFETYLSRVVRNGVINYLKTKKPHISLDAPLGGGEGEEEGATFLSLVESPEEESTKEEDEEYLAYEKEQTYKKLQSALTPFLYELAVRKAEGQSYNTIQQEMNTKYGKTYKVQYYLRLVKEIIGPIVAQLFGAAMPLSQKPKPVEDDVEETVEEVEAGEGIEKEAPPQPSM